ncbi:MAG TPA: hypothetical protein PL019_08895 [Caldisericia bacterium]|nr:hypothetical protein [Caldisericia bacterium]HPI84710.1 hypothetical protein [Caldisericia bacterium]
MRLKNRSGAMMLLPNGLPFYHNATYPKQGEMEKKEFEEWLKNYPSFRLAVERKEIKVKGEG